MSKQFTSGIPHKLKSRIEKLLKTSTYTTRNGFIVGAVMREIERLEKRGKHDQF